MLRRTFIAGLMGTTAALTACENKGGAAKSASTVPQTVTIASISYPFKGKQTYNGLTQVVRSTQSLTVIDSTVRTSSACGTTAGLLLISRWHPFN